MTSLVTGATGLLGSHLTSLLVERGERPRALVMPSEPLPWSRGEVEVCRGDLRDRSSLERALTGVDLVFHCAARTGPTGPPAEYLATNVRGLQTLLEVAVLAGVRRVVHVSSVTVHGNDVGGIANEDSPLRGEPNPYSRSKLAGERLVATLVRERAAPVTVVRPGWIYGPGDLASFARFASLIQQRRMVMFGAGHNHLPLVYVGDAAQGLLLAGESKEAAGRTYLLVNDEPVTQLEFLSAIATELGVPPPRRRLPYRLTLILGAAAEAAGRMTGKAPPLTRYGIQLLGGENRFLVARARQELGFSPQVGVHEGVRRSVEWFLGRPESVAA